MRLASCLIAFVLSAFTALLPASAQQRPALPHCEGVPEIIRVSTIKPGKMETFMRAVAAQAAWYKQQGTTDEISVIKLVDMKSGTYSDTEAMTTHTEPEGQDEKRKQNAGYDAFVALYRESSDVKQQFMGCRSK